MNKELYNKILEFDLDSPMSEYGFSTRLARENYWTKNFTEKAIIEYKKFMFLAATSDLMVSPSEIIDVVWHQHLIFTQSYQEFCNLIGRQIQHIPSTHNKEDFQKFKQAKERTKKFYVNNFGEQPGAFWEYADMYESLQLDKAKIKIRSFIIIGILALVVITIPGYFLLKPVYLTINNPGFIIGFIILAVATFTALEIFNQSRLRKIVSQFSSNSFIFNLQPLELVYLQTQKLQNVINGVLNELVEKNEITISNKNTIEKTDDANFQSTEKYQVMDMLDSLGRTPYSYLLKRLMLKPIFTNTANCMDAFKKYFIKSKKFGALFYTNFGALAFLLMLGLVRFSTGILRDRPVTQIAIAIVVLTILIVFYLDRLTKIVCTHTVPKLYKTEILPARQTDDSWQWSYFLLGTAVLTPSFASAVNYADRTKNSGDSSGGCSSCGSSCGSSCSSCGGCGGS